MLRDKLIKLLAVALFCIVAPALSLAQTNASQQKGKHKTKVETNYDAGKNETTARIGPFELSRPPQNSVSGELNYERVDLAVTFTYPGKRIVKPASVMLVVFAASEGGARFEKKRDLSITTEAGRYDLGEMEFVGKGEGHVRKSVSRGGGVLLVDEMIRKSIPFDDFMRIASSERAEMMIGGRKINLETKHLEAFRNFALLMEQEGLEF